MEVVVNNILIISKLDIRLIVYLINHVDKIKFNDKF